MGSLLEVDDNFFSSRASTLLAPAACPPQYRGPLSRFVPYERASLPKSRYNLLMVCFFSHHGRGRFAPLACLQPARCGRNGSRVEICQVVHAAVQNALIVVFPIGEFGSKAPQEQRTIHPRMQTATASAGHASLDTGQ